jgi:hypothetical protein
MRRVITAVTFATLSAGNIAHADPTLHGPTPYRRASASPFWGMSGLMLDTLEDGALNLSGVMPLTGFVLGPGPNTDSVDADDGVVDGSGTGGHSWWTPERTLEIAFDASALGRLPRHVGLCWTDGRDIVTFEAFGADGASLGTLTGDHPDLRSDGRTAEDRFYGVSNHAGISRITISSSAPWNGVEVDHIQYVLPAPHASALLVVGALVRRSRVRAG